jgi:hypothetical protein
MSHGDMTSQLISAGMLVIRCEVTIHQKESYRGYILPQAVGSSSTLVQEQRGGQEWALHRLGVECGEHHPRLQ